MKRGRPLTMTDDISIEMRDVVLSALRKVPANLHCGHVVKTGAGAVCAMHPELGLLCERCGPAHLRGHQVDEEHCCDRCGELDHTMTAVVAPLMTLLDGRLISAFCVGIGLCQRCTLPAVGAKGGVG